MGWKEAVWFLPVVVVVAISFGTVESDKDHKPAKKAISCKNLIKMRFWTGRKVTRVSKSGRRVVFLIRKAECVRKGSPFSDTLQTDSVLVTLFDRETGDIAVISGKDLTKGTSGSSELGPSDRYILDGADRSRVTTMTKRKTPPVMLRSDASAEISTKQKKKSKGTGDIVVNVFN